LNVPKLEEDLGIEVYGSKNPGIGGKIRSVPEDFRVEEILTDGSKATTEPKVCEVPAWGRHLLCVLVKRNWDTLIAVRRIAEYLSIDSDRIQIAGIKDARALTAQHITISGVAPEKISRINIRGISVKPLRFVDEELSTRLLFGNSFHTAVRGLDHRETTVEKQIEAVRSELENLGGLPNFFGHQRFGSRRPITHLIGHYIVRRDYRNAVLAFLLKASEFEYLDSREARKHLDETRDCKDALNSFPERLVYERLMLKHLAKYPRDYLGALNRLPLRLRRLFVQSYQSLLFNKFLSRRIKQGIPLNEPQVGDCIVDLDELGLPTERCREVNEDNLLTIERSLDDKKAGISIPLVGFRQPPSKGMQGTIEETILEKEDIRPSDFYVPEIPRASSPGGLRLVLTPILNFHSEETSEDPLNLGKLMTSISFTLRRSSYATILLREFMKPQSDFGLISSGF